MSVKNLQVKCPNCSKTFNYYQSMFRPFCCEKCKMIDLGNWLDENYRVPVSGSDDSSADIQDGESDDSEIS